VTPSPGRSYLRGTRGRFGRDEPELHRAAGGVVDVDEQRARRAEILELWVLAAVDLDELAEADAPVARLVGLADPLAARRPQAGDDEPLAERLAADPDVVQLEQLLVSELRPEVGAALAEENATIPKAPVSPIIWIMVTRRATGPSVSRT
jgi:hypothetical protein